MKWEAREVVIRDSYSPSSWADFFLKKRIVPFWKNEVFPYYSSHPDPLPPLGPAGFVSSILIWEAQAVD